MLFFFPQIAHSAPICCSSGRTADGAEAPSLHLLQWIEAQEPETVGQDLLHAPKQKQPSLGQSAFLVLDAKVIITGAQQPGKFQEVQADERRLVQPRRISHQGGEALQMAGHLVGDGFHEERGIDLAGQFDPTLAEDARDAGVGVLEVDAATSLEGEYPVPIEGDVLGPGAGHRTVPAVDLGTS